MTYLAKKICFSVVLAGVVVALIIWLVILPILGKISQASNSYLENQKSINFLDKQVLLLQQLKKDYLQKENQLSNIERAYLPEEETVGFITTLEQIASQTGNEFEIRTASAVAEPSPEEGEHPFLSLHISLWGDFNGLLEFLANLEDSPYPPYRLTQIDRVSIQRIGERTASSNRSDLGSDDLETVLRIKVYTEGENN